MTVEGKVGIKETKEVLKLGILGKDAIEAALADGKIGLEDLGHIVPLLGSVSQAVEGVDQIPAEIADLDAAEFDELVAVAQELIKDVTPDSWEDIVFDSIALAKKFLVKLGLIAA